MAKAAIEAPVSPRDRARATAVGWCRLAVVIPARLGAAVLLAMSLLQTALATQVLQGKVLFDVNGQDSTPASGVTVSAARANRSVTNSDGGFTLTFPDSQPGDSVRLQVEHPGWLVVNERELVVQLPSSNAPRQVEFLLCEKAAVNRCRVTYYTRKCHQVIEDQYQRQLRTADQTTSASAQEAHRLQLKRDSARQLVDRLVQRLSEDPASGTRETENVALRLILDGRIDDALSVLDQSARESKPEDSATDHALRADLLILKLDFEATSLAYKFASRADPESPTIWFDSAHFHQFVQKIPEAREAYREGLAILRKWNRQSRSYYLPQISAALYYIGTLDTYEGRYADAVESLRAALEIYRALVWSDHENFQPRIAIALNRLGNLRALQHRYDEALKQHEAAVEIIRALAKENPGPHLGKLAYMLNDLGMTLRDRGEYALARRTYDEALKILRSTAAQTPGTSASALATTLINVTVLDIALNHDKEALQTLEEALSLIRPYANGYSENFDNLFAIGLGNKGLILQRMNYEASAHAAYVEALSIHKKLAESTPGVQLRHVARLTRALGRLYF